MRLRCNNCGQVFEDVPENFFEGGAAPFWRAHGHPPSSATLLCICGATHDIGPDHFPHNYTIEAMKAGAMRGVLIGFTFYLEHHQCEGRS